MSLSFERDREQNTGRPSAISPTTARMQSSSPGEAAAKPASMTSTPSAFRVRPMRTLSSGDMEKPGACSPSRMVVSKTMTRFGSVLTRSMMEPVMLRLRSDRP